MSELEGANQTENSSNKSEHCSRNGRFRLSQFRNLVNDCSRQHLEVPNNTLTGNEFFRRNLSSRELEKLEEAKIKAKFPMAANKPLSGHSAFLQKRLAKGQKFFDSGDYNMARQKQAPRSTPATVPVYGTGETIPTPETVPVRKTSIIQPKFPSSAI